MAAQKSVQTANSMIMNEDLCLQITALVVIGVAHVVTVVGVIVPWMGASAQGVTVFVVFNFLLFMIYFNYYKATVTDPGTVPSGWTPQGDIIELANDSLALDAAKRQTKKTRYCKICASYKPPRSHHCSHCHRCVLKMDHHCPWVGNCVGFHNQAYFYRFLFYVVVACSFGIVLITTRLFSLSIVYHGRKVTLSLPPLEIIAIVIDYLVSVPVLISVGILFYFHSYYIMVNSTTIESYEMDYKPKNKDHPNVKDPKNKSYAHNNPYNINVYANICSVLGPNPWLWFWPLPTPGDGLHFEVNRFYREQEDNSEANMFESSHSDDEGV